jgi:3',5'-cyclic AMP phosphodiesterase CpdA
MSRLLASLIAVLLFMPVLATGGAARKAATPPWTFAVSGDSRNCGDFVMPAIAAKVKAENDVFYWHLGDFRWITMADEDFLSMQPLSNRLWFSVNLADYRQQAWDDFRVHQLAAFGSTPVFLSRGNHDTVAPMSREGYIAKFSEYLNRPEIAAQRQADGPAAAPIGPWYHWNRDGVDFITLDNASPGEFSDAQLSWLRAVLDRDLAANSGIRAIVVGMHEALPHSTGSNHAMDAWSRGDTTGEQVYNWFYAAQAAGKHVYLIASHSHYYAPNVYETPYWRQQGKVIPGWIIGIAGAHRYKLPEDSGKGSLTSIYGYMQGTVNADGSITFVLHQLSEDDLVQHKWPDAPLETIHECYIHNTDGPAAGK